MAGTRYEIDVQTRGGSEAARMASALEALTASLTASGAAAVQSAQGIAAATASYNQAEVAADKAAKTLERAASATAAAAAEVAAAWAACTGEVGTTDAYDAAVAKLQKLSDQEHELRGTANALSEALGVEAAALDAAKTKATAAAAAHDALNAKMKDSRAWAAAVASAAESSQEKYAAAAEKWKANVAEAARAEQGHAAESAQAIKDKAATADAALKKNGDALRNAEQQAKKGATAAFGIVAAIAAVTIGFLAGAYAIASWAVELADANRTAKMGAKDELSLSNQTAKLKKNLAATFGGLKIDGLLKGLSTMVNLLDANTASGRFLKFVFEGIFQPFIDAAAGAIPKVERLLLGVAIGALQFYISIKPAIAALKEMGVIDTSSLPDILQVAIIMGKMLAGALAAVVIVVGAIVGAFYVMHQAIGAGIALVQSIGSAITGAIGGAFDYLSGLSFADIGTNLIASLAGAITGGAGAVIAAITGVASGAIAAAKAVLGIASPSKVFAAMGDNVTGTFAATVDSGAADAEAAMANLVAPPSPSRMAQAGGTSGAAARGGNRTITIEHLEIHGDDAKGGIRAQVIAAFNEILAGDAMSLGGGEVPA